MRLRMAALAAALSVTAACGGTATGEQQLTIWSMWSEGEPNQKVLAEAIKDFSQETGIKVKAQWKGRTAVKNFLPSLNTATVPADLIEGNHRELTRQFAATKGALDLSDLYATKVPGEQATVGETVGEAYKRMATSADGVLAQLPYQVSTYGWFFNGKDFPDLAANPPKTWDDFVKLLDAQKGKGRKPLGQDGSIPNYNLRYLEHFGRALMGDEGWHALAPDKSGQGWLKPEVLKAAQLVEALAKGGYFPDGFNAAKFPAMQQKWANGESDFLYQGTYLPKEVTPYAKPGFEFHAFRFPEVGGRAPTMNVTATGFGIPKKSKNAEAAKKFLAFFLQKKYQDKVAGVALEMSVRKDVPAPPVIAELKKGLDAGEVNRADVVDMGDFNSKVLLPLSDQLLFGKVTAAEFTRQMAEQAAAYWKSKG
ncbi:ABC transporter substrate-binding protein [Nonomuraea sp. NPDC050556]|uniref:ABC transporter substrate-binding protein n=1 Tax=Nonomuraea sp. NPDC050556 TaxID=3364369 RepID=UPI0037A2265C